MRSVLVILVAAACGDNAIPEAARTILSGNETASCVIDAGGALYCWGRLNGGTGELGDPANGLPAAFGTDRWGSIAVGPNHACGIQIDGTLRCWGRNCGGQLGDGTREARREPVQVGTGSRWQQVAVGGGHSCAIDEDGILACWGGLDYGQNDCDQVPTQEVTLHPGTWRQVSSGWYSTHGIRSDGTLWRWRDHELASATVPFELPAQVGTTQWRSLASGLLGAYGVRADGTLAFLPVESDVEVQIGTDDDWGDAIAGRDHACALKLDQTLWCWGRNDMGQLGTGSASDDVALPVQVGQIAGWTAVTAGWAFSCAVYDGDVYCWGANGDGEVGIGMPYTRDVQPPSRIGIDLRVQ